MKSSSKYFRCNQCSANFSKWIGQCPECDAWNSISQVERPSGNARNRWEASSSVESSKFDSITVVSATRISTGIDEFDRVLGGGIVDGTVVLLGGDPGIGKTTLLMQVLSSISKKFEKKSFYISAEESLFQLKIRSERLQSTVEGFHALSTTSLENIIQEMNRLKPFVIVVDSIQTIYSELVQSPPGSVAQVKECASQLVNFAKTNNITIFLIGHVTKDGALAGPRILEHMVDVTLYFENCLDSRYRMVRSIKNRFGTINELGVFFMSGNGLKGVKNPNAILLSQHKNAVSGSVTAVSLEGSRPFLVEVQALIDDTSETNKRLSVGIDSNRISLLIAVLQKHGKLNIGNGDVYVNLVGGLRSSETAIDLPLSLALISSLLDRPVSLGVACFGEIGLSGEVRPVKNGEERIKEVMKQGFQSVLVPAQNLPKEKYDEIEIIPIERIPQLIQFYEDRF